MPINSEYRSLSENITRVNTNKTYDCLLMYSGGKDSTYLLYYLSEVMGLRVATVSLMHDFMPSETRANIQMFADRYSKKHIPVENTALNVAGRHFLEAWINQPEGGSLITLCTGCRLGLIKQVVDTAKDQDIPVVISGETPYEASTTRMDLINWPQGKSGKIYFVLGYIRAILKNIKLISSFKALLVQSKEFYYFSRKKNIYSKNDLTLLKPFYSHIRYDESQIIEKLDELGWRKPQSTSNNSYWRSDCEMYAIRHYFYNQVAGFNEMKEYYGKMRDQNMISEDYFEKKTSKHYAKEEIIDLLYKLELSSTSMEKYREFVTDLSHCEVPFPGCGSCKGLQS